MTVGQRIAQKRKELGLSQEALGERLGVSRQAIYKWESDATLPEIEKLVALSREFSVSVGWLLGVEDSAPEREAEQGAELTETQLRMVEEIVARYLAARPEPEPPRRRRLPLVLLIVAAVVLAVVFISLFSRLDRVTSDYNNLQNSISRIDSTVSSQIGSIASQVESILKSQNELTASYGAELLSTDLAENTVTFAVRATPKTYTEGMSAVFTADSGGGPAEFAGELGPGREFSAQVTCPLTDSITLSVVFVTGDRRETQVLDQYDYLYTVSFPEVYLMDDLWGTRNGGKVDDPYFWVSVEENVKGERAGVKELRAGLFRDRKLVAWYERLEEKPDSFHGDWPESNVYFQRPEGLVLEPGHIYCEAVLVTDKYGRQWMAFDIAVSYDPEENFANHADVDYSSDPSEWEF